MAASDRAVRLYESHFLRESDPNYTNKKVLAPKQNFTLDFNDYIVHTDDGSIERREILIDIDLDLLVDDKRGG